MGVTTIIRLQEERVVVLGTTPATSRVVIQSESQAANVLPYAFVTPFFRIKSNPAPSIDAAGITVSFSTAALLNYQDESLQTGERFAAITGVTGLTALTAQGTYMGSTITTPGGLIIYQVQQQSITPSIPSVFTMDLYLVCRGY